LGSLLLSHLIIKKHKEMLRIENIVNFFISIFMVYVLNLEFLFIKNTELFAVFIKIFNSNNGS